MKMKLRSDQIRLRGLRVRGNHGVYDHERVNGQNFILDVTLRLDLSAAAATDDMQYAVHYGELAEAITKIISGDAFNLIESLAAKVADLCLEYELVWSCRVTVHKPDAPIDLSFQDVSVTMTRSKQR